MGKLRTFNKRLRRRRMKARGLIKITFNPGQWTWIGALDDFYPGFVAHIPLSREQPHAYRDYRP